MSQNKLPKIFVQIASYRDPECEPTIRDLYAKAKHPERINVALCWQYKAFTDDSLLKLGNDFPNVTIDAVPYYESKGVSWARTRLQKKYAGEDYTLMIDSHMRFVQDWDELMIEELRACPSEKPVLSNRPSGYTPPDNVNLVVYAGVLKSSTFDKDGVVRVVGHRLGKEVSKPLVGAFVAAGYIFTLGKFINEIPYDPYHYFETEEITLSARIWTNGWDIFSPSKNFLYHRFFKNLPYEIWNFHWNDNPEWEALTNSSIDRYRHIFGMSLAANPYALIDIAKYSLGTKRSLAEYEAHCGINFRKMMVSDKALTAGFVNDDENDIGIALGNETQTSEPPNSNNIAKACNSVRLYNLNIFSDKIIFESDSPPAIKLISENIPKDIMIMQDYLPPQFCKYLCDYADSQLGSKLKVTNPKLSTKDQHVSMESPSRITEHVAIGDISAEIITIFNDIYTRRVSPFFGNVKFEWYERPQILRYLVGGKYDPHSDSHHKIEGTDRWEKSMDRDYSVLLYLNEDFEGGILNFTKQKFRMKPRTGMLVAFPSDENFIHAAEPTTSGKRYAIVSWASVLGVPKVKTQPSHHVIKLHI
jgi:hypothetical protein